MTVLLYGSSQTHPGTSMPSGGGHIIKADQIQSFSKDVILPAYSDAVALAKAAETKNIASDLGEADVFFADIARAKLGQWDTLQTVGAQE